MSADKLLVGTAWTSRRDLSQQKRRRRGGKEKRNSSLYPAWKGRNRRKEVSTASGGGPGREESPREH